MSAQIRELVIEAYTKAVGNLEQYRIQYYEMRNQHLAGQDLGLPGWSPTWTRELFDLAHLREWMKLSEAVSELSQIKRYALKTATEAGLEPLEWQDSSFYQPGSMGYGSRLEKAFADKIMRWDDGEPLVAGNSQPDAVETRGGYIVDWPAEREVFEPAPTVGPGDSGSCAGLR